MGHDASLSEQKPLSGVILCCTSLPTEHRTRLVDFAQELGAIHRLDLTSDVTHLLVGRVDTPKYVFVARERPDVQVLRPEWVEAVRHTWTQGGDVDLAALEEQYKLPPFFGATICMTGFEDIAERSRLTALFEANGAKYHGDLTKEVSHLVAAGPRGKKYEHALQWGIKVVAIEWVKDSISRGMILEERLYLPTIAPEDRGVGAVKKALPMPTTGKRKLTEENRSNVPSDSTNGARKFRRTASARCESQGDELWAEMRSGTEKKISDKKIGEWEEAQISEIRPDPVSNQSNSSEQTVALGHDEDARQHQPQGIMAQMRFVIHGFPERHETLLCKIIPENGGKLPTTAQLKGRSNHDEPIIFLVPHQMSMADTLKIPYMTAQDICLTEFWLEKCLSGKQFVDHTTTPLCTPFPVVPLDGLSDLVICPSSFSGVDLLHFKKAVEHLGARYDESLHQQTSVLVCNHGVPNMRKLGYALDYQIPVVHAEWFWQCIKQSKVLPFARFVPRACHEHVKAQRQSRTSTTATEPLEKSRNRGLEKRTEEQEATIGKKVTIPTKERALKELSPEMNSPTKASSNDLSSNKEGAATSNPTQDVLGGKLTVTTADLTQNSLLDSAIAHLLAQRKDKALAETAQNLRQPQDRRQRKLGRVQSASSSLGTSRSLSHMAAHSTHEADDLQSESPATTTKFAAPSQSLTYEDPEAAAARERLMSRRRSGAVESHPTWPEDDEDNARLNHKKVKSIGLVKDYSIGGEERRSARRAGTKRQQAGGPFTEEKW